MPFHERLDLDYGPQGDRDLRRALERGEDPEQRWGPFEESWLHVATRRYRSSAVELLIAHGVELDARTKGGKTAWVHAARRGFDDLAQRLAEAGASRDTTPADELAMHVVHDRLDEARALLARDPGCARTGNPEEDRLLADVAGRGDIAPVAVLVAAGADLCAPGLDDGTPLHQCAWFGQPTNARLLIEAGAPLDVFDGVHQSSPIGWVSHGSRYSGGAAGRQSSYVELARLLLEAGCSLAYPDDPEGSAYLERLLRDATPAVADVLRGAAPPRRDRAAERE